MPIVRKQYGLNVDYRRCYIVDPGYELLGAAKTDFVSPEDFSKLPNPQYVIAIGSTTARKNIDLRMRLLPHVVSSPGIASHLAQLMRPHYFAPGAIITAFCCIQPGANIGRHFQANLGAIVGHDCEIGDYVTLSPGAMLMGDCRIGDGAYIGAGAILREKISVGAWATVGAGAVVVKDVPPGVTVVGNPAHPISTRT